MNQTPSNKTHRVLMVSPEHFDVLYSINPFMKDSQGRLHQVNRTLAQSQWSELKSQFERAGLLVDVLQGQAALPDMVFAANQALPFLDPKTGEPSVILSHMRSPHRQPEVAYFKKWFLPQKVRVHELESKNFHLEGTGDVLPQGNGIFWGGIGPRTDQGAYDELRLRWNLKIVELRLVHKLFYHLDTCLVVLDGETGAYIEEALAPESVELIRHYLPNSFKISLQEGAQFFAGNAFCPDGKNVFLQRGAVQFKATLLDRGFMPHEVETGEFIKSGGSVFCMKLVLPW